MERKRGELRSVTRGARTCARMGRGRPGLIRGCLSHTSRRYPDLLSCCRVVCRGDKHEKCAWHGVWLWHRAVKPRWLALQQTGHGGCIRAVQTRADRLALAQDPALALKLSPAASPFTRPPMASSLKISRVGQRRWRCTDDVTSSPQTTSPQPGDHSPCLHCLSMQTTVVCVGACVPAYVRVHAHKRKRRGRCSACFMFVLSMCLVDSFSIHALLVICTYT